MCGVTAWSSDSAALSGGLMVFVCLFVRMHFILSFDTRVIVFLVAALSVLVIFGFVYVAGVAPADVWSFHTHHLLQRLPRQPQRTGQAHQRRGALPHCLAEPRESSTRPRTFLSCTPGNAFNRWCGLKYHTGTGQ